MKRHPRELRIKARPPLPHGRMILSFTGWMDGGDASTGTVNWMVEQLGADKIAEIDPDEFYIYNFPGSMEIAAMFRPDVKIEDGQIVELDMPTNTFYAAPEENLALFVGKEPNLRWRHFSDCIFAMASELGIKSLYFVGTFAGSAPHTREPRLYASVTSAELMAALAKVGVKPSDYEGPGSFATYLMAQAKARDLDMISLVAEIPGYIQGTNPRSIEAVARKLSVILGLPIDLNQMRMTSDEWENQVSIAVEKDPKLAKHIRKLEEEYDDELIDHADEA